MNTFHSRLTDWGLSHISVDKHDIVLDVGCGGGRTVNKLAALVSEGKVYGVDYSPESVAAAIRENKRWIEAGKAEISEASVSQLPFSADTFDLITAVETHFWWPDLAADMREVSRVLKPGGTLLIIAEIYKGAKNATAKLAEKQLPLVGLKLLSEQEHRELFENAGYADIEIITQPNKGWICCTGKKRLLSVNAASGESQKQPN